MTYVIQTIFGCLDPVLLKTSVTEFAVEPLSWNIYIFQYIFSCGLNDNTAFLCACNGLWNLDHL